MAVSCPRRTGRERQLLAAIGCRRQRKPCAVIPAEILTGSLGADLLHAHVRGRSRELHAYVGESLVALSFADCVLQPMTNDNDQ